MKCIGTSAPQGALYRAGAAGAFVTGVRTHGRVSFALDELTRSTGLSTLAARRQLSRLGGDVVRVAKRQEYFLVVDPEHRAMGAPPPAWWLDAYFQWLGRPYYLALQSAAAAYGSSAQAPQVTQVMTDRPRKEVEIGRIRVRFFVKAKVADTQVSALAGAFAPLAVSSPAATAIDLVRYADRMGGIERAAETLQPLLPRVTATDLRVSLGTADIPTVQRLGFILVALGWHHLANVAARQLPGRARRVALSVGTPQAAPHAGRATDKRWAVAVNATL
jgi:predicted transcriptional regulator of viral defense system